MKTVLEYLRERKEMADHNLFCNSATYAMDTPKKGYEERFAEATRDGEIVDELIALVEAKETPAEQTPPCNGCTVRKQFDKFFKLAKEIDEYVCKSEETPAKRTSQCEAASMPIEEAATMICSMSRTSVRMKKERGSAANDRT